MKIDLKKTFPYLARAPIVEAVIELRAKLTVPWDQDDFQKHLKEKLPDYPKAQSQRAFQGEFKTEAGKPPEQRVLDLGWSGLLFRSQDQLQVAQFQKEGFVFSRLQPYQKWEAFEAEALRLWNIYVDLVRPPGIQRVGVRFINRMPFPADGFQLGDYLKGSPQPLVSLGLFRGGFLYQDSFMLPETNYSINLVRVVQPSEGVPTSVPVILDIDVFTNSPMELNESLLKQRLAEMRCLKNEVFFDSITSKTKEMFQ